MNQKLKQLEALVVESVGRLKKLTDENRKLKLQTTTLQEEAGRLELQLRRFQALSAKHQRIKSRIERLVHKLDKLG